MRGDMDRGGTVPEGWEEVDLVRETQRLLRERRFDEAVTLADALTAGDGDDVHRLLRAMALAGAGRSGEARAEIDGVRARHPLDARVLTVRKQVARLLDDADLLADSLAALLRLRHNEDDCVRLGRVLRELTPRPSPAAVAALVEGSQPRSEHQRSCALILHEMGESAAAIAAIRGLVHDAATPEVLVEASAFFHATGDPDTARRLSLAAVRRAPIVTAFPAERPAARLLVVSDLMAPSFARATRPSLANTYGGGNFPAQLALRDIDTAYGVFNASGFAQAVTDRRIDAVLCNFSFREDRPADFLARFDRFARSLDRPVLNHPRLALAATRDGNYRRFGGRGDIVFPRTLRLDLHDLAPEAALARIEGELDYPIILRPTNSHDGGGMVLAEGRAELVAALAARRGEAVFAIQFHACRRDRADRAVAYRMVLVDGRLLPVTTFRFPSWSTHAKGTVRSAYRQSVLSRDVDALAEDRAFIEDFENQVLAPVRRGFQAMLAATGLDIVGMDFGYLQDGRPIVFEINAAMLLLFSAFRLPFMPYYIDSDARIAEAIRGLVLARIGAAPAGRKGR
ncbi:MAG: hypothetical protein RLO50_06225 [Azospirillaceae bacterium]